MSIHRGAKFYTSGSLLVMFFYVLLAVFTIGLSFAVVGGLDVTQLLYVPILIGISGMGVGALIFSREEEFQWKEGKKIAWFIFIGSGLLVIAHLFFIIAGIVDNITLVYPGDVCLILSTLSYSISFYFLQRQMAFLYLKKVIIKYPNYYVFIGFIVQAIAYLIFSINWFIQDEVAVATLEIIGIVFAGISILLLVIGFIPINIAFRAYPHLVEDENLRPP